MPFCTLSLPPPPCHCRAACSRPSNAHVTCALGIGHTAFDVLEMRKGEKQQENKRGSRRVSRWHVFDVPVLVLLLASLAPAAVWD